MTIQEISLIKITPDERTKDGNLTQEGKKRALDEIRKYISNYGYMNVSELSGLLGLSRQTTRTLVNEVLDELREEEGPQLLAQIKWHQDVAATLGQDPEAFTEKQIKVLKFQSAMLGKITLLQRLLRRSKG